jgi:hypothetical protein
MTTKQRLEEYKWSVVEAGLEMPQYLADALFALASLNLKAKNRTK